MPPFVLTATSAPRELAGLSFPLSVCGSPPCTGRSLPAASLTRTGATSAVDGQRDGGLRSSAPRSLEPEMPPSPEAMSSSSLRLSASVMTHNSLSWLPRCVEALAFCDEVVLVDDGSTDGMLEWAARQGPRVRFVHRHLDNLPSQRRFQRDTAQDEWLLIVDADEVVTPGLAREVLAAIDAPGAPDAFHVNQLNVLPASWPGAVKYRTSQKRLLRRSAVDWTSAVWVHAPVVHRGRAGRLRGHLEHQSFDSVPHLFKKQLVYGLSTGRQLHARGRRPSLAPIAGDHRGSYRCRLLQVLLPARLVPARRRRIHHGSLAGRLDLRRLCDGLGARPRAIERPRSGPRPRRGPLRTRSRWPWAGPCRRDPRSW